MSSDQNNNDNNNMATLLVAESKDTLPRHLNGTIATLARQAIAERGAFTVALSGGSLPSFLSTLHEAFGTNSSMDAKWDKWHILLADERCVPESDDDSNMGSLKQQFLSHTKIPSSQIHGINETMFGDHASLTSPTNDIAVDYEKVVQETVTAYSGGLLDLAVLGFGPDGHTCSLFPNHALLEERTRWVAPITDSPKPPPNRITLTLPVLNQYTRHVIICGAGTSKGPILTKVLQVSADSSSKTAATSTDKDDKTAKYTVAIERNPPPFPCAMVKPTASLTWMVDADAVKAANFEFTTNL